MLILNARSENEESMFSILPFATDSHKLLLSENCFEELLDRNFAALFKRATPAVRCKGTS